ncbi:MAG: type II secretion system F family protein [Robiginitomaculum sp.]|nr:type II secretion system F family protein [Robiginitomaculum sp.]
MSAGSIELFKMALILLVILASVATLYTLLAPLLEGNHLKRRMGAVSNERDTMRKARMDHLNEGQGLRSESKGFVKNLVDNLSLERLLAATDLKDKMSQAGLRGQRPVYMFYLFRLVMPILLLVFGILYFVLLNPLEWGASQSWLVAFALMLLGYYAPGIYVKNKAGKRMASIAPVFPDALDLLLICVESGMSIELAFGKVSREMAENSMELAEEFSLTTAELSYLQSRRQAYENLARRNNHVGIRAVSTALIQTERYGTPLGSTLRTMADENRQMRILAAEKKAAALPAKLTVPMILFFLPVLFIVILTPAGMRMAANLG